MQKLNEARRCGKIIIIEDTADIRECFQVALESEGYRVESFSNGRDALAHLRKSPEPCLILLDMMMPIMGGEEFMREFLKFPATLIPVPVYLCTASGSDQQSKRMGCAGYIKKPLVLEVLFAIAKNYCVADLAGNKRKLA